LYVSGRDGWGSGTLLQSALVCYKPSMRKWMRERIKRRKKSEPAEQPQTDATQAAPLQPAYFEAESPSERTESAGTEADPEDRPDASDAEPSREDEAPVEASGGTREAVNTAGKEAPKRRRRRGRGGRGRTQGTRSAPAPVQPEAMPQSEAAQPASSPRAIEPAVAPVPQVSKGVVVLAIGLPGSGKTSWFKRHNIRALSSDLLRQLLFDDPEEQRYQDLIFSNLRSMLKARMIARRPTNYVDATNLSPHDRHTWIKLARDYGYDVHAVFFDVPLDVCLERNRRRHRVVGEDVMRRMAAKFRPPTFEEGFSKITVVRVKKKEAAS
jgi:predicted kinase